MCDVEAGVRCRFNEFSILLEVLRFISFWRTSSHNSLPVPAYIALCEYRIYALSLFPI